MIGPNGSGKTTLLRALIGAIVTDRTYIAIGDEVLVDTDRRIDPPIEHRKIGYVPQGYGLFPHLNVIDNVAFGLSVRRPRASRSDGRARAQRALASLGCAELAFRPVAGLSGGEQQRVALARALVIEPRLVLLDEPMAALDPTTRRSVRRALAERLRSLGPPTIIVTHDVRDVAHFGAVVCVMEYGRVVQTGSLDDLRASPASDFVAEFVGEPHGFSLSSAERA